MTYGATARYYVTDGVNSRRPGELAPMNGVRQERFFAEHVAWDMWRKSKGTVRPHIHAVVRGIITAVDVWRPNNDDLIWLVEETLRSAKSG